MRANAERDIDHELRRLLGLLLLELYRDANKSPNAGSDLREAGEYAKAAVAELKRLKLDAPQANLRKALIELVDAFALRDAVKGRSALPENELLAVAKTVYALPRVRDEIERFLFPDLEATCQLLSILHFDLATLPRTAVEVLLCLDDNSELHLVDSSDWETIDVRVMPSGRRFGQRISIRATTTPHPYWDGTSKLKTAGLLVGTNIAPHRLTAFGRAVRQVCLAALRRRSLGSRLLSSVGRPFVSRPPRAEEA